MKTRLLIGVLLAASMLSYGQRSMMELTFTAFNIETPVQLDSIKVMNRTQGGETMLYWPDTVFSIYLTVGLDDQDKPKNNELILTQNYPNPFSKQTSFHVFLKQNDKLVLKVTNILGQELTSFEQSLPSGYHMFTFNSGAEQSYILSAAVGAKKQSIKMFGMRSDLNGTPSIIYHGTTLESNFLKSVVPRNKTESPDWDLMPNRPPAITIEPPNATAYDIMTLIFDPELACFEGGSLSGLPDIAIHSGVTINTNAWQHIVWFNQTGANGQETTMSPTGDGRYGITYTPSAFYGLTGEVVTEICAVFNNGSDWTQDGRDFDENGIYCMDFFIPINSFSYDLGDELLFVGYSGTEESGILDAPLSSETYEFQFATNIPCIGTPFIEYEGKTYNTIQIYSQCWLKENLDVGLQVPGNVNQSDNGIIEKYCFDNMPDSCLKYGGFYQWNELMQYSTQQGTQGICPPGWHVPTDEEWKVLEGAVDSQFGIGSQEWDVSLAFRGYNAGTNLKTNYGWNSGGNGNDLFGFRGLPGGFHISGGIYYNILLGGNWWTSTQSSTTTGWNRYLSYFHTTVDRNGGDSKNHGFSVRCVKD